MDHLCTLFLKKKKKICALSTICTNPTLLRDVTNHALRVN